MRADRLLALLLLLQTKGRMTARDLAAQLEVSERTVYRDLDALSAAGVPVYAERGPGGGCALPVGYRTSLTGLTAAEVRTLVAVGTKGPLADLGLGRALDGLMLKLLAALPAAHRVAAERTRQRLYLDAAPWFRPRERLPHLPTAQEAVWQEQRLRLAYRRRDGSLVRRVVDPYGLIAKAGIWYLAAQSEGAMRAYRVARIEAAEGMAEGFQRDPTFDLAAFWAAWCAEFEESLPRYQATVRVAPAGLTELPLLLGDEVYAVIEQAGPPDANGWLTLPLTFESLAAARRLLLGLGPVAEVLEPVELRKSVASVAAAIVAIYRQGQAAESRPRAAAGPVPNA